MGSTMQHAGHSRMQVSLQSWTVCVCVCVYWGGEGEMEQSLRVGSVIVQV